MKLKRLYTPQADERVGNVWMWRRVSTASEFKREPHWGPNSQEIEDSGYCLDNMVVA